MEPLVSIIMPNFNGERFIKRATKSVCEQDFKDWELIIVDDASTDSSQQIIKSLGDPRIHYHFHRHNRGVAAARNTALTLAKGRYICFLDSDDYWVTHKLTVQLSVLKASNCAVAHSSYYVVSKNGDIIGRTDCKRRVTYRDMLRHNYIGNLTGIYDCEKVGKRLQKNIRHEDYAMWLDLIRGSCSVGIAEPLAFYRKHSQSLSANKLKSVWWSFCVLRRQERLSIANAIMKTLFHIWIKVFKI